MELPIRTVSEANRRDHHMAVHRRKRAQQQTTAIVIRSAFGQRRPHLPVHVHLVRIGPRRLDTDNLVGALKHVRDEVARWLGVDDGDAAVATWSVDQEIGALHAVRLQITERGIVS